MKVIIDELVVRFDTVVVADVAGDRLAAAIPEPEVKQRLIVLETILKTILNGFQKARAFFYTNSIFLIWSLPLTVRGPG